MSETLGQWLKARREELGMSLRDVERATEGVVSNAALSQIETGKIERPSLMAVVHLAAVYALPSDEIFSRALAGKHYEPPMVCPTCGREYR